MNSLIEATLPYLAVLASPAGAIAGGVGLAIILLARSFGATVPRALRHRLAKVQHLAPSAQAPRHDSVRRRQSTAVLERITPAGGSFFPSAERLSDRLSAAGIPIGAVDFLALCCALALVSAVLIYALVWPDILFALASGLILTIGIAHLTLTRRIERRNRRFVAQLPEAIDLIVRGVRSGLPVTEAMTMVAAETEDPLRATFREITSQVAIGRALDQALWDEARRLSIPELKFFVISLSIQQETGGNLAEVLDNLATMIRRREQLRLKIKAMSSEARASAMIIGSLPFVMAFIIYLVNPDYMLGLVEDPRGWMLIAAGLTSLGLGVGIMAKMVRFEI